MLIRTSITRPPSWRTIVQNSPPCMRWMTPARSTRNQICPAHLRAATVLPPIAEWHPCKVQVSQGSGKQEPGGIYVRAAPKMRSVGGRPGRPLRLGGTMTLTSGLAGFPTASRCRVGGSGDMESTCQSDQAEGPNCAVTRCVRRGDHHVVLGYHDILLLIAAGHGHRGYGYMCS